MLFGRSLGNDLSNVVDVLPHLGSPLMPHTGWLRHTSELVQHLTFDLYDHNPLLSQV